jgi:DNA polymerase-3 subunit delta'
MLIGHQKQWQFLKKSVELGRLSHAYLFTGQEKLGKKTVAFEFIKLLFGQPSTKPLVGGHHDFIFIEPAINEIQIGQIRDLNWRLSLKPFSAPFKAAVIDQAHLMNAEAQNCFLKTLEEPRGETILILITEYPEFLFPTIRSRSEIIKFYPVPRKEIENYLKGRAPGSGVRREMRRSLSEQQGITEKKEQLISQISQGRPGVAIDFLNQPQKLKEREALLDEIIKINGSDLTSRFQYAQKISKTSDLKKILSIWLFYFRENLISSLDSKVEFWKVEKLTKILEKIQKTFFLISTTNVNPRLALETIMLEF